MQQFKVMAGFVEQAAACGSYFPGLNKMILLARK